MKATSTVPVQTATRALAPRPLTLRAFSDQAPAYVYAKVPDEPIKEANQRKVLYQAGMPYWANAASYLPLAEGGIALVLESGISED